MTINKTAIEKYVESIGLSCDFHNLKLELKLNQNLYQYDSCIEVSNKEVFKKLISTNCQTMVKAKDFFNCNKIFISLTNDHRVPLILNC